MTSAGIGGLIMALLGLSLLIFNKGNKQYVDAGKLFIIVGIGIAFVVGII
jgi:hypothetical protein